MVQLLGASQDGPGSEPRDVGTGFGWTARTYVLEGRINRLLLGNFAPGDTMRPFFAKYECITDYIWVDGTVNGHKENGVIPEPATMLLFATGTLGLAVARRRRKK